MLSWMFGKILKQNATVPMPNTKPIMKP